MTWEPQKKSRTDKKIDTGNSGCCVTSAPAIESSPVAWDVAQDFGHPVDRNIEVTAHKDWDPGTGRRLKQGTDLLDVSGRVLGTVIGDAQNLETENLGDTRQNSGGPEKLANRMDPANGPPHKTDTGRPGSGITSDLITDGKLSLPSVTINRLHSTLDLTGGP